MPLQHVTKMIRRQQPEANEGRKRWKIIIDRDGASCCCCCCFVCLLFFLFFVSFLFASPQRLCAC
jgi:hypothetical protein